MKGNQCPIDVFTRRFSKAVTEKEKQDIAYEYKEHQKEIRENSGMEDE